MCVRAPVPLCVCTCPHLHCVMCECTHVCVCVCVRVSACAHRGEAPEHSQRYAVLTWWWGTPSPPDPGMFCERCALGSCSSAGRGSGSPRILPLLLRVGPAVCPPSWLLTSHVLVLTVEHRFAYVLSPERPWESPVSLASGHAPCSAPHVQSRPRPCHGVTRVAKSPEATADWQGVGGLLPWSWGHPG